MYSGRRACPALPISQPVAAWHTMARIVAESRWMPASKSSNGVQSPRHDLGASGWSSEGNCKLIDLGISDRRTERCPPDDRLSPTCADCHMRSPRPGGMPASPLRYRNTGEERGGVVPPAVAGPLERIAAMSRLLALVASTIPLIVCASPIRGAERPNILWLVAEDFGPELACYGTEQVSSPNLDRLAARGVRFTRAYTTAPVCSASRSAFMTGMYQTTIGAHNHRSHRDDGYRLPAGVRLITDRMRESGYVTANIRRFPASVGFAGTGKTDWNFTTDGNPFDYDRWDDLKAHRPFFAQVNFQETHRTFHAPRKVDPAKVVVPPYYPDHPVTREDWAQYLDSAIELDRKVGLILAQLEADGLAETTIVVFMGDHGQA